MFKSIHTCCTSWEFLATSAVAKVKFLSLVKLTVLHLDGDWKVSFAKDAVMLDTGDKLSPVTVSSFSTKPQPSSVREYLKTKQKGLLLPMSLKHSYLVSGS